MGKDYNRHFTKSANPNVQMLKLASILGNTIKVTENSGWQKWKRSDICVDIRKKIQMLLVEK